jgi:hypothetical protein
MFSINDLCGGNIGPTVHTIDYGTSLPAYTSTSRNQVDRPACSSSMADLLLQQLSAKKQQPNRSKILFNPPSEAPPLMKPQLRRRVSFTDERTAMPLEDVLGCASSQLDRSSIDICNGWTQPTISGGPRPPSAKRARFDLQIRAMPELPFSQFSSVADPKYLLPLLIKLLLRMSCRLTGVPIPAAHLARGITTISTRGRPHGRGHTQDV